MGEPVIELHGLKKYFKVSKGLMGLGAQKVRAVDDVDLVINEGVGTWQLGEKAFPARKSDILHVEPWLYHGLTNTGTERLIFVVVRFNSKGVAVPPRPDTRPDEE